MIKEKTIIGADFCRDTLIESIDVFLKDRKAPISLFEKSIKYSSRKLSKNEIATVILILRAKKEVMSRKGDFPYVYDEMLSDLITAYKERYGVKTGKKRKLGYSMSMGKLEEILSEYYKIKELQVYSIDVGSDRSNAERIDLDSDYRYLVLSFREVEEE